MENINHPQNNFQQKNILNAFLEKYFKFWPVFALSIVVGLIIIFLYLRYYATTQYEIQGKILIQNTEKGNSFGDINDFESFGLFKTANSLEDEIGILTSSGLIEEVITENAFNARFYLEGNIRDVEIYGEDVPVTIGVDNTIKNPFIGIPISLNLIDSESYEVEAKYDNQTHTSTHSYGDLVSLPYGTFTIAKKGAKIERKSDLPIYFTFGDIDMYTLETLESLTVLPANETGNLLDISYISSNKKRGEAFISKLIETYIDKTIKFENELAENTIKMIDERLRVLTGEIEDVENTIVDFKTENTVTDIYSNADTYIQQSNDYKSRVTDYQTQIKVLEQIELGLTGSDGQSIGGAIPLNDAALNGQIERYNQAVIDRNELSQSAGGANPLVKTLDENLSGLRQSILQNVKSLKNGYSIARGNLLSNAYKYDARIAKVPQMEKQLLDISRDKSTKEGLYLYLLQKREEEVLSLAAPVSSTRIVSLPKASMFPVSPNKKLNYLFGLLLGLIIPVAFVNLKDSLNNKISSKEDIEKFTSAPIAGEIYHSENNELIHELDEGVFSSNIEAFRLLQFNLNYLKKDEENKTLLVTSSIQGEGKSYVSANLATSLARSGEKVILVSFDLRKPRLMEVFNMPKEPGITDFILQERLPFNRIIQQHDQISELNLIGPGAKMTQVGRLLLSKRIEKLMGYLKKNYDRIIIDTAPIGMISDAYALNSFVDSTLFVVRKNVTPKANLKSLDEVYTKDKLRNTMVIFNDTEPLATYGYSTDEITE